LLNPNPKSRLLPKITIPVPPDFEVKGKRGKGSSQINKHKCEEVASWSKSWNVLLISRRKLKLWE
jgi:hypothetical protein